MSENQNDLLDKEKQREMLALISEIQLQGIPQSALDKIDEIAAEVASRFGFAKKTVAPAIKYHLGDKWRPHNKLSDVTREVANLRKKTESYIMHMINHIGLEDPTKRYETQNVACHLINIAADRSNVRTHNDAEAVIPPFLAGFPPSELPDIPLTVGYGDKIIALLLEHLKWFSDVLVQAEGLAKDREHKPARGAKGVGKQQHNSVYTLCDALYAAFEDLGQSGYLHSGRKRVINPQLIPFMQFVFCKIGAKSVSDGTLEQYLDEKMNANKH